MGEFFIWSRRSDPRMRGNRFGEVVRGVGRDVFSCVNIIEAGHSDGAPITPPYRSICYCADGPYFRLRSTVCSTPSPKLIVSRYVPEVRPFVLQLKMYWPDVAS